MNYFSRNLSILTGDPKKDRDYWSLFWVDIWHLKPRPKLKGRDCHTLNLEIGTNWWYFQVIVEWGHL